MWYSLCKQSLFLFGNWIFILSPNICFRKSNKSYVRSRQTKFVYLIKPYSSWQLPNQLVSVSFYLLSNSFNYFFGSYKSLRYCLSGTKFSRAHNLLLLALDASWWLHDDFESIKQAFREQSDHSERIQKALRKYIKRAIREKESNLTSS